MKKSSNEIYTSVSLQFALQRYYIAAYVFDFKQC